MNINFLNLGLIRNKETGKVCSHRLLWKILFNPFLRYFFDIAWASNYDNDTDELKNYEIMKIDRNHFPKISLWEEIKYSWIYKGGKEHTVEFKHWLY